MGNCCVIPNSSALDLRDKQTESLRTEKYNQSLISTP